MREAVVALMETADAARSFEDMYERVRVQADTADLLWPFDEQAARSILSRAWDVTTAPGVVNAFRWEDENDEDAFEHVLKARRVVIACASKHDARLADVYMKGLMQGLAASEGEKRAASGEDDSQNTRPNGREPSPENLQRLEMASALLDEGAYEAAAALAEPALNDGASRYLVGFIMALRVHAPREADALYLRLLERTRVDPQSNANDVMLLSQPIVSPEMQVYVDVDGSIRMRPLNYTGEAMRRAFESAPEARRAFYATAASVLLRTPRQSADGAQASAESSALYFAVGRLLPFFEREAAQYAPALHARMSALAAEVGASRAQSLDTNMGTLSLAPKNPVDPLAARLGELSKETDAARRDRLRLLIVSNAAHRALWERARSVAAEVEDAQSRREAFRIIAVAQVMNVGRAYDDEPNGFERAADFVRAADVPPEFRAAGLGQAAELAAREGKRARADALLEEALPFASQAGKDNGTRLTALVLVAHSAARVGSARVWEILPAIVAESNEVEDDSDAQPRPRLDYGYPDVTAMLYENEKALNLEDLFAAAARVDFRRAMTEARSLEDELTRANVTIAVVRAAFVKSGKSAGDKVR